MTTRSTSNILIGLAFVLILWISAYAALSRRGYAEADRWNSDGFHYFTPDHTDAWRTTEGICTYVFWPLNFVDRCIGTGREHSAVPFCDLS
ncbi:MAG TPA: hypothetical protein VHB77_02160 [Planctomycetaceae bacterium]|nr:hypothetical protein [Planctomycetaceae bacterium]